MNGSMFSVKVEFGVARSVASLVIKSVAYNLSRKPAQNLVVISPLYMFQRGGFVQNTTSEVQPSFTESLYRRFQIQNARRESRAFSCIISPLLKQRLVETASATGARKGALCDVSKIYSLPLIIFT
jgi:hypothetical protein